MLPVDANPTAPDSGVVVKRSASDDDEPHCRQSKEAPQQKQQQEDGAGQDAQVTVASDKGQEATAQDNDDGTTPRSAKKLKQQEGFTIDVNKALQQDDDLAGSPSDSGGKSSPRRLSLKIKKREMEIDVQMLELEERRLRWAKASRKKDRELENMRLENGRMKLENQQMWVQLRRREWEVGIKSKRV